MKNIVLIGMPGSGKSTLGVLLAKFLGYDFVDMDIIIQKATGKKLSEIIEERGNEGFLDVEGEIAAGYKPEGNHPTIIATGGSVVYRESAMRNLRSIGKVVYLSVPCEELEKRLHHLETRGVAIKEGMTFAELYEERRPLYEKYADITVDEAGSSLSDIVELMMHLA